MPGVAILRARADNDGGGEVVHASNMDLLLPSAVVGKATCPQRLQRYEWRLRYAQAQDTLDRLRGHLLLRTQLWGSRDRHIHGQHLLTRSAATIENLEAKIKADVKKYNMARAALLALSRPLLESEWLTVLRPLELDDVTSLELDVLQGVAEGHHVLSWIWKTEGVGDACGEGGMQAGM